MNEWINKNIWININQWINNRQINKEHINRYTDKYKQI